MENTKVKAEIVKAKMTIAEVAKAIGVNPSTLSLKLSEKSDRCLSQVEMIKLSNLLRMEDPTDVFSLR